VSILECLLRLDPNIQSQTPFAFSAFSDQLSALSTMSRADPKGYLKPLSVFLVKLASPRQFFQLLGHFVDLKTLFYSSIDANSVLGSQLPIPFSLKRYFNSTKKLEQQQSNSAFSSQLKAIKTGLALKGPVLTYASF